jgi:hypothetical protein
MRVFARVVERRNFSLAAQDLGPPHVVSLRMSAPGPAQTSGSGLGVVLDCGHPPHVEHVTCIRIERDTVAEFKGGAAVPPGSGQDLSGHAGLFAVRRRHDEAS